MPAASATPATPANPATASSRPARKPLSAAQRALQKLGLVRDIDLALHLPLRYEDATCLVRLADAREGQVVQIEGVVTHCELSMRARRQLLVRVDDGSDACTLRFFSFYPSQQKALAVGARVRVRGELKDGLMGRTMLHPVFEPAGGALPAALTPVYPSSAQLPQAYLRKAVANGLGRADLTETLPREVWAGLQVVVRTSQTLREALRDLHQPGPDVPLAALDDRSHPAWQRLKAEELLAQQLSQLTAKRQRDALRAPVLRAVQGGLHEGLLGVLPFSLTAAQARVGQEIAQDLSRPVPMQRLLQGDVGSGKTVVAALAAAIAMDSGWQCALMAPTEILVEQHFTKLVAWLEPLLRPLGKCVAWLSGSQKKKQRAQMLQWVASGRAALVVGTHAVIQEQVVFERLGLGIIDEQHRFGVAQRLALRSKMGAVGAVGAVDVVQLAQSEQAPQAGLGSVLPQPESLCEPLWEPHVLMMTATPIPRTLAMSYYADLEVSTIDELPPGRTPVVTRVLSHSRRAEVIERIAAQVAQGRQVYWVCPLIEHSEALDLSDATATHAELTQALNGGEGAPGAEAGGQRSVLEPVEGLAQGQGVRVGLLHSRMAAAEKKEVMAAFVAGRIAVLVCTTVIEVGVDVPNASLMVIEHAQRFGLSQLHQLRGRVGRGAAASACVLLYTAPQGGQLGQTARARLQAMVQTHDGFEIARRDLDIRGPGEFLGARQSGAPLLRFADLSVDSHLLDWARRVAPLMLIEHPQAAQRHIERWLGTRAQYLKA